MSAACINGTTSLQAFLTSLGRSTNTSIQSHIDSNDIATCSGALLCDVPPLAVFVVFFIIAFFIYLINIEAGGLELLLQGDVENSANIIEGQVDQSNSVN